MSKSTKLLRIGKAYGIASSTLMLAVFAYVTLLAYPQPLFGHSGTYSHNFKVYSREPIPAEMQSVLNRADEKLRTSPIYSDALERRVFLAGGWNMYAFLTNKSYRSFGSSIPFFDNIMLTKSDITTDRMFVDRPEHNSRSLSGVIAHEVMHLLLRQRYGTAQAIMLPTWKNEGYCEYVAGESTMPLDEAIKRWREDPADDVGYRYAKYHLMVKYLIENEHLTIDQIMTTDLKESEVAAKTYASM